MHNGNRRGLPRLTTCDRIVCIVIFAPPLMAHKYLLLYAIAVMHLCMRLQTLNYHVIDLSTVSFMSTVRMVKFHLRLSR